MIFLWTSRKRWHTLGFRILLRDGGRMSPRRHPCFMTLCTAIFMDSLVVALGVEVIVPGLSSVFTYTLCTAIFMDSYSWCTAWLSATRSTSDIFSWTYLYIREPLLVTGLFLLDLCDLYYFCFLYFVCLVCCCLYPVVSKGSSHIKLLLYSCYVMMYCFLPIVFRTRDVICLSIFVGTSRCEFHSLHPLQARPPYVCVRTLHLSMTK